MSKRTERMSWSAAERINRKDTVIRQNNTGVNMRVWTFVKRISR